MELPGLGLRGLVRLGPAHADPSATDADCLWRVPRQGDHHAGRVAKRIAPRLPLDYRLLLSGYLAEYAQEVGALTPGVPYAELHDKGRITQRALDLGSGDHFSTVIRQGVPGTEQDPQ